VPDGFGEIGQVNLAAKAHQRMAAVG